MLAPRPLTKHDAHMESHDISDPIALPESLLAAVCSSDKGLALIRKKGVSATLTWANPSFFRILGGQAKSSVGRDIQALLGTMGSSKAELEEAIEQGASWLGWSEGMGEAKVRARLDVLPNGNLALWIEHDETDTLQGRLSEAMRKVEEFSGMDEKTGFSGPKAFWRSVGSLWAVCARNQLPVALAMVVVRPHLKEKPGTDYEAASKAAFSKSFRRASDIVGRLGQNSFAVFIVGQDAQVSQNRLEMFASELGDGYVASIGLASGMPLPGSSTHAVKILSKRMLDKAFESKGSAIESGAIFEPVSLS